MAGNMPNLLTDVRRDRWFTANEFLVIRYWNNDVLSNLEGVLISLLEVLNQRCPKENPAGTP